MGTSAPENVEKRDERIAIFFLAVVLAPIVAVLLVAGYGFCVWMYQLIVGPPSL
jgi:nitrate reductase NapE